MSRHTLLFLSAIFLASLALVTAGQAPAAAPFTADQASAGRTAYATTCAGCHGADLAGPPPLAGTAFRGGWGSRTTRDLLSAVQSMPPEQPGGLPEATYLSIVAYILQSNGATPGTQALTTATTVPIGSFLNAAAAPAPAGRGAGPAAQAAGGQAGARGRGQPAPPVLGLTVAGEIRNYARVTDDMLRNPPAGDWPMLRRDQAASDFSPLNQITRDNVGQLQLAWVAPMAEGGTNQPSPLAHDGVIFLNNSNGIFQALDGRTGDLIWEQRLGVNPAMRGMSLYDDKLFMALSNGHLVALEAKSGKVAWDAAMPDGRGSSSGPIVAKGKLIEGMGGCSEYSDMKCFISATTPRRGSNCGSSTRWPSTASQAGTRGGRSRASIAPAARPGSPAATIPI